MSYLHTFLVPFVILWLGSSFDLKYWSSQIFLGRKIFLHNLCNWHDCDLIKSREISSSHCHDVTWVATAWMGDLTCGYHRQVTRLTYKRHSNCRKDGVWQKSQVSVTSRGQALEWLRYVIKSALVWIPLTICWAPCVVKRRRRKRPCGNDD